MKHMTKMIAMVSLLATLTACHENPLPKQEDQEMTAQFLVNASSFAEKELKFKSSNDDIWGRAYLDCAVNKVQDVRGCEPLYVEMVAFAKAHEEGELAEITVADLSDKEFQRHIVRLYKQRLFFKLPKAFSR
jgi:hypothetical protein